MRIDEAKFRAAGQRAEAMGVAPGEAEKFLEDLKTGEGKTAPQEVVRPLLRMLEGKKIKGGEDRVLLDAVRELYEYGDRSATRGIAEGRLAEWPEAKKSGIKLLVAALEGWLFDGHAINIRREHFPLLVFMINRLAKIAESQTRDAKGDLLVPDYAPEQLRAFVEGVQSFSERALNEERLTEAKVDLSGQWQEITGRIQALEQQKQEKIARAKQADEANPAFMRQKRKAARAEEEYRYYLQTNSTEMRRELEAAIAVIVGKIRTYKLSAPAKRPTAWSLSPAEETDVILRFFARYRNRLINFLLEGFFSEEDDEHFDIASCANRVTVSDDESGNFRAAFGHIKDRLAPSRPETAPPQPEPKPLAKIQVRGKGFGALAALKDTIPATPSIQDTTLYKLLYSPLSAAGPLYAGLIQKFEEKSKERAALRALTAKPEVSAEEQQISELERVRSGIGDRIEEINRVKRSPLDAFRFSKNEITADLNRPGTGLYLLKSIVIALKQALDQCRAETTADINPYTAVDLSLRKEAKRGPARAFDLAESAEAGHETVHYLPQHMSFALMAAAEILERGKAKSPAGG